MNRLGTLLLKTAAWVLVPVIPLLITSGVIAFAVNFQPLYEYGFDRYDVGDTTGLADAGLSKAARGLIDYFNSGEDYIDLVVVKGGEQFQLFNEREIAHLYDVKGLIRLDYGVLAAGLAITAVATGIFLFRRQPRSLAAPLFWGGSLTLIGVAALAVIAIADFDAFFTRFHLLSFTNDFWMLDPATDYLIRLFPDGFWQDASIFVGTLISMAGASTALVDWHNVRRTPTIR